jgi:hypothetical protein
MKFPRRLWLLLAGFLVAGWLALFGDKTPSGAPAVVVEPKTLVPGTAASVPSDDRDGTAMDDVPESGAEIHRSRGRGYLAKYEEVQGVELFHIETEGVRDGGGDATSSPVQEAPVCPFVLIGRMLENANWQAFLERGNKVYIVKRGDTVDGFRIETLDASQIVLRHTNDSKKYVIKINGKKDETAHE